MADDGQEIILAQMESSFNASAISQAKASRSTRLQTKNGKMPLAIFRERYAVVVRDSILPNDVSIFSQRKPLRNGPLNRISKN
jgi:hypothetical protein